MEDTKMKKEYINPTIEVVKIGMQQVIAASPLNMGGENPLSSENATGDALGKEDEFDW